MLTLLANEAYIYTSRKSYKQKTLNNYVLSPDIVDEYCMRNIEAKHPPNLIGHESNACGIDIA